MRAILALVAAVLVAGATHAASGERIYQWMDSDGKTQFGDLPPADARDVRPMGRKFGNSSAAAPKPAATDVAANQAECANKRKQIETFRNATRLIEKDSLGREKEFTAEERELLIKKTQAELESQCGGVAP